MGAVAHDHVYRAQLEWSGSTAAGYEAYDRTHSLSAPPAAETLTMSADPAFRGDPALLNPEQLLVAAASSCQMLSFLAIAARSGIDVVAYRDDAEAVMPEGDRPVRITRIVLRPSIAVRGDTPQERILRIVQKGHEECYIANSLTTEVVVEATVRRAD
jgi:organic hydroperoxide reductase OsmC/OhrA